MSMMQGVTDTNVQKVEANGIYDHAVNNSTRLLPDELQDSVIVLPEHRDVNCLSVSSCDNSCIYSEKISCSNQTQSSVNLQTVSKSFNRVSNKQAATNTEVEPMNCDELKAASCFPTKTNSASLNSVARKPGVRLSERIKRTLQQNANVDTPTRSNRLLAVIEKYDIHATGVTDVGSFHGLPEKVRNLLQSQRSITELYRWLKFIRFLLLMTKSWLFLICWAQFSKKNLMMIIKSSQIVLTLL